MRYFNTLMFTLLRTVLVFASLLIHIVGYNQKIIIGGQETNRQLIWSDFSGIVDNSSPYYAVTRWNLRYTFDNQFKGDSLVIANIQAILELDPLRSWVKKGKETNELLVHEQGHFNIGILCMNEMIRAMQKTSFMQNNFMSLFSKIINEITSKYYVMGQQYDQETSHGTRKKRQQKWNEFFTTQQVNQ
jgi:hypothetical protein